MVLSHISYYICPYIFEILNFLLYFLITSGPIFADDILSFSGPLNSSFSNVDQRVLFGIVETESILNENENVFKTFYIEVPYIIEVM